MENNKYIDLTEAEFNKVVRASSGIEIYDKQESLEIGIGTLYFEGVSIYGAWYTTAKSDGITPDDETMVVESFDIKSCYFTFEEDYDDDIQRHLDDRQKEKLISNLYPMIE